MARELLFAGGMLKLTLVGMMLVATQGCVLGTRPAARHVAMGIDGALIVGGVAMAATANSSSSELGQSVVDGATNSLQSGIGVAALVAGLAGLAINLAMTPSEPPAVRNGSTASAPTVHVAPSTTLSMSALTIESQ